MHRRRFLQTAAALTVMSTVRARANTRLPIAMAVEYNMLPPKMSIMERFGEEGEPLAMVVVYTDVNGDVVTRSNCVNTHSVGLMEYAKHNALVNILGA